MNLKSFINKLTLILTISVLVLVGCTRKVTRISPNEQLDISGRWNNTDSRLTSEEITQDVLNSNWLSDHLINKKGEKPVVIVGFVVNKSHEHIDAETFTKDLEQALIRSGKVRVVQGGKKREEIRGERADQQMNSSRESMKQFGLEQGADYMLQGSINSIVDAFKKQKVVYYQVNLELTNIQTNEIVWIGDKKIAKYVKN